MSIQGYVEVGKKEGCLLMGGEARSSQNEFHVGNLYITRKCTGALVGIHPLGGFNMSGTDYKAGGSDCLLLFTQAKTVSEKIG